MSYPRTDEDRVREEHADVNEQNLTLAGHIDPEHRAAARAAEVEVPTPVSPAVGTVNALTARWSSMLGDEDFALSAAGVWPLLALLGSAADEAAGVELATALGRPTDAAHSDALDLLDVLRSGRTTTAAMGLWVRKDVPLHTDWTAKLPERVVGQLTDQAALNQWAADETGRLVERFPLTMNASTMLVIASALTARARWREPFDSYPRDRNCTEDAPERQWLTRTTCDLSAAVVLDDKVTRVIVEGDGDLDVHLLLGNQQPADVLATGLRGLSDDVEARPVATLGLEVAAPGVRVRYDNSTDTEDTLHLKVPSFGIQTHHDLLEYSGLFGLRLIADSQTSHLPLLSPIPLSVTQGAQDALVRFFAEGFDAASVTAFALECTGAPPPAAHRIKSVTIDFDRPFGFLAVHRSSRLAVFAGWVSSPFRVGQMDKGEKRSPTQTNRLSKTEIEGLKAQGLNQSEIAEMFGVSRQAVSWHLKTYGGQLSPRQKVNEVWPWETSAAHGKAVPYKRLRDHGEFMATGGRGMNEDKLARLRSWWRKLRHENLVVEFDPDIPPIPGVSPRGGFAYRERDTSDADELLIRVNKHTRLTEDGRDIWCWPPDL